MNTDHRRPLGTGPTHTDPTPPEDTDPQPGPRAVLAAERLPIVQAAVEPPADRTAGRRILSTGPAGL